MHLDSFLKRLAGKNVSEMTHFVSSGHKKINSINQSINCRAGSVATYEHGVGDDNPAGDREHDPCRERAADTVQVHVLAQLCTLAVVVATQASCTSTTT